MTDPISNENLADAIERARLLGENADTTLSAGEVAAMARELQSLRQSPAGVEIKPSAILSQIALWSDDEGLELSMSQGNDLVRRIMSVVRAAGISEQMLIDAFIRGESWRKRNDVDRYVAVPEMVNKAARDYADAALFSESHNG